MLGEGPVVNEISGLFRHVYEPLRFSLQRLFYLLMAAVSKGMKLLAGVAGIHGIVGAVRMNWEGTCTDVPDVLRIDDAAYGPFRHSIAAVSYTHLTLPTKRIV